MSKSVILGSLAVLLSIGSAQAADSGIRSILGRWCAGTSWPVPKKGSGDFARLVYMFQNQGQGKLRLNGHWAFKSHRHATTPEPGMYSSMSEGTYAGNHISVIGSITKSDNELTVTAPQRLSFRIHNQYGNFAGIMTCGPETAPTTAK